MSLPVSPTPPAAPAAPPRRLFRFDGGSTGPWQVLRMHACTGLA